jgi:8-oxo-dGTP diphosphatase
MTLPRTPALATDCVVFDPFGRVLLVRRGREPCAGKHALPGGFVKIGETIASACRREVREETGIDVSELTLVGVYSDINRDPRGHIVSVAFMTELTTETPPRVGSGREERRMGGYGRH